MSLVALQRRCAAALGPLAPNLRAQVDKITAAHLSRVKTLTKAQWEAKSSELETKVALDAMRLAATIAGMEPCDESDRGAYMIGMRGKPGVPCNFSHWWIELPTGRFYKSGEPERVRCETYPNAPIYFTPCAPGATKTRGTFRIAVRALIPAHAAAIAAATKPLGV